MKTVRILTILLLALTIAAAAGGWMINDLYLDNAFYTLLWQTNDRVTLLLVAPLLAGSLYFSKRGSQRAQLIWMGLLAYLFYNYAFYLFGAAFNRFFLLYTAIYALALFTLAFGLWNLDVPSVGRNFSQATPVKWIAVFMGSMALPLAVVEIGQCVNFIIRGEAPSAPSLIFALDIAFVIPYMVLAAVLIWQRRAWGFVLSAIMLVKGVTYGAVLSLNAIRLTFSGLPERDALLPFYLFVLLGSVTAAWALLKNLKQSQPVV